MKEPARRMIGAISSNEAYLGTNRTNPFRYKKTRVEYDHCVSKWSTFCKCSNIQQLTKKLYNPAFNLVSNAFKFGDQLAMNKFARINRNNNLEEGTKTSLKAQ